MKSIWSGSLSFGLINIPINLYSASEERSLNFKLFEKNTNCPISYIRICKSTGKEVQYRNITRGFEYEKGNFVILDEEDFKKASPKKTELVEIVQFSNEDDIDPIFYEKPYYVEPDKKSAKAYALLKGALSKTKKVAIARFVLREKEHIAAIRAEKDVLILNQLRFNDEIRSNEDINVPEGALYNNEELEVAISLIKHLDKKFDPSKFKDTYTDEMRKIIDAKAKGKTIKVSKEKVPQATNMKDLMKLLKESLDQEKVK